MNRCFLKTDKSLIDYGALTKTGLSANTDEPCRECMRNNPLFYTLIAKFEYEKAIHMIKIATYYVNSLLSAMRFLFCTLLNMNYSVP